MAAELLPRIDNEPGIAGMGAGVSLHRIAEAARSGNLAAVNRRLGVRVQETMTTSDFTHLADELDRGMLASIQDAAAIPICYDRLGMRRDTTGLARAGSKGHGIDYQLNGPMLVPQVAEKGEYKPDDPTETYYTARTYKYGRQWDLSWEAWLADNRDLGLLMSYPDSWGLSVRYTRQSEFTSAYAANATLFTSGNGNLMSGAGSQLDFDNLVTAVEALTSFADPAGNVSVYGGKFLLVVPPALFTTAQQLVDPSWLVANKIISNSDQKVLMNYPFEVVRDQFLPSADTTNGTTSWYVFCDPRIRPAMRYGFLRGYEDAEVWMRDSDARSMAGGDSDPFGGSFLDDDIAFKLRFTFGADPVMWQGAYRSTGEAAAE